MFTSTARFRGSVVRIKELKFPRKKDISRDIMKQMRLLRDLRHDNINSFIGACVEPMRILLVTDYCSKGSLYDIIENEDIKLDDLFIASLLHDLVKVSLLVLVDCSTILIIINVGYDVHSRFCTEFPRKSQVIELCGDVPLDVTSHRFWTARFASLC